MWYVMRVGAVLGNAEQCSFRRQQGGDDQTATACARPHPCTICRSCTRHRCAVTSIKPGTDTVVAKGRASGPQQIHQKAEQASLGGKPARCTLRHFGHDCKELKVQNNSRVVQAPGTPILGSCRLLGLHECSCNAQSCAATRACWRGLASVLPCSGSRESHRKPCGEQHHGNQPCVLQWQ